jgi:hypothetical protein
LGEIANIRSTDVLAQLIGSLKLYYYLPIKRAAVSDILIGEGEFNAVHSKKFSDHIDRGFARACSDSMHNLRC